jgi:hypothetical protein
MKAAPSANDLNRRILYSGLIVGGGFIILSGIICYVEIVDALAGVVRFRIKNFPAVTFYRRDDPEMFWSISVFNVAVASFLLYFGGTILSRTMKSYVGPRR